MDIALSELKKEYQAYLDDVFFKEHPNLYGTDNCPEFEWWMEHVKHIRKRKVI